MRFHKSIEITGPEAAFLLQNNHGTPARPVVVSFDGTWYDVRSLSTKELEGFIDDLTRIGFGRGFTPH
jgi:hypothetical protein